MALSNIPHSFCEYAYDLEKAVDFGAIYWKDEVRWKRNKICNRHKQEAVSRKILQSKERTFNSH